MTKTDISKNNLYIKKLINVVKANNPNHHKLLTVNNRRSDAFVYIISGSCTYRFSDNTEFIVKEGDIFYLAHNSFYTMYIHTTNYQFIFCDFEFDENSLRKSDVYSPQNFLDAENVFRRLLKSYSKASFSEAMSILYTIYNMVVTTANSTYIEKSAKNKISKAKEYIDTNFKDTSLSVNLLAEKSEMSEVYFRKLFKSQYDISPSQYMISVRLKKAKELMKYPFLTLEECALQSGFSSVQYFCRIFKKVTGITPSQYKKTFFA